MGGLLLLVLQFLHDSCIKSIILIVVINTEDFMSLFHDLLLLFFEELA